MTELEKHSTTYNGPMFDADNHYYEAEDAFTRYVPKRMQHTGRIYPTGIPLLLNLESRSPPVHSAPRGLVVNLGTKKSTYLTQFLAEIAFSWILFC